MTFKILNDRRIVFNKQNIHFYFTSLTGKSNSNDAPFKLPGFFILNLPSYPATNSETTVNPIPIPPGFLVTPGSKTLLNLHQQFPVLNHHNIFSTSHDFARIVT